MQQLVSMNVCTQETFKSDLGRAWGRRNNVIEAFILNKESRNINLNEWSMVTFLEPFFQLCGGFKCANMLNLRTWKVTSKPKMLQSVEFRNKLLHSNIQLALRLNRRYFTPRSHHTSLLSCQFLIKIVPENSFLLFSPLKTLLKKSAIFIILKLALRSLATNASKHICYIQTLLSTCVFTFKNIKCSRRKLDKHSTHFFRRTMIWIKMSNLVTVSTERSEASRAMNSVIGFESVTT